MVPAAGTGGFNPRTCRLAIAIRCAHAVFSHHYFMRVLMQHLHCPHLSIVCLDCQLPCTSHHSCPLQYDSYSYSLIRQRIAWLSGIVSQTPHLDAVCVSGRSRKGRRGDSENWGRSGSRGSGERQTRLEGAREVPQKGEQQAGCSDGWVGSNFGGGEIAKSFLLKGTLLKGIGRLPSVG